MNNFWHIKLDMFKHKNNYDSWGHETTKVYSCFTVPTVWVNIFFVHLNIYFVRNIFSDYKLGFFDYFFLQGMKDLFTV